MIDHASCMLAIRNRIRAVVIATTGTTSIAATTTGYTRSAGSFVADGFLKGMEVLVAGFAQSGNNGYKVITNVAAGTLTVRSLTTMVVEAEGGNESIIAGLPGIRGWENESITPVATRPYIEEDYAPGTHQLLSAPASGALAEETGIYFLRWYGLADEGPLPVLKASNAVLALVTPNTRMTAGSATVRVRDDVAPIARQAVRRDSWSVSSIEIPWRAYTTNTIAA